MALDIEKRFLSNLLHASRSVQDNYYAKQIPTSVFRVRTKELSWVNRYRDRYGVYPTPSDFRAKFHEKLLKVKSPLEATLQPVLDRAMFEQMCLVQDRAKKLLETEDNVGRALAVYRTEAQKLTDYSTSYTDIDVLTDEGADERYRSIVKAKAEGGRRILDTPWYSLNRTIGHMSPGEQVSITARYSIGKSWVVSYWAHYLAKKGFRVGIFSKEMPGEQFQDRIECLRYRIDYPAYREGELTPKQLRKWRIRRLKEKTKKQEYCLKIFGNEDNGGMNHSQVIVKVQQYNLDVVFFDGAYLQRPPELPANTPDTQRFMYLSNRTKELAKMLRVLWINTLQDNRGAEDKKGNTKGGATTVYGSDAWGQDSDWLLQIGGRRGSNEREISLNKGRESDLVEFKVGFQVSPCPDFKDKGPKPKEAVEVKLKKKNKFIGVK